MEVPELIVIRIHQEFVVLLEKVEFKLFQKVHILSQLLVISFELLLHL